MLDGVLCSVSESRGLLGAFMHGACSAVPLVANITVSVIAFISILAFLDGSLSWLGGLFDYPQLSFMVNQYNTRTHTVYTHTHMLFYVLTCHFCLFPPVYFIWCFLHFNFFNWFICFFTAEHFVTGVCERCHINKLLTYLLTCTHTHAHTHTYMQSCIVSV